MLGAVLTSSLTRVIPIGMMLLALQKTLFVELQPFGVIIQIVAIVGRGLPGIAHSAAARAGVVELSKTLAFEWGPKVRVNCVAPGAFRTDGWEKTYDEEVGNDMSGVPLPYPGRPHDIANSVVFLASPAAGYVTGECLYVDGGHVLHDPISALPPDGYPERR